MNQHSTPTPRPTRDSFTRSLAIDEGTRPSLYAGKSFAAFRVTDNPARTYPVQITGIPRTIDEARDAAIGTFIHKEKLLIRETDDATGRTTLHLWAVKKKAAQWRWEGSVQIRFTPLFAEKLCEIDGALLSPRSAPVFCDRCERQEMDCVCLNKGEIR
jgi:hypothetical protein